MNKPVNILLLIFVAVFAAPLIGISALSLSPTYGMNIFTSLQPSLRWWRELLADPSWAIALASSAAIGSGSALTAIILTIPAALAWRLEGSSAARNAMLLAAASLTFPPIVLAVGLYQTVMRFGLFDTAVGLGLAYLSFTVPIAAVVLSARFRTTPMELYLVAKSLGAGRVRAAMRWLWATQRMTLMGCFAAAVLTSISEVTVAMYVTDASVPTIARRALAGVTRDLKPTGFAALAAWIMLLCLLVFPLVRRLGRER